MKEVEPGLRKILERMPEYRPHPRLPSDWLRWQMIERWTVLRHADLAPGMNVLEIGCGPQAIATVPLALAVGSCGRVVALDRGRWGEFHKLVEASGLQRRVIPVQEDARSLPFPDSCFDLVVCIHGARSFESREALVAVVKEMLRVSKERIFIAESSPIAKNKAQKAHLAMYNLRRPVFLALGRGALGDMPYFPPKEMERIAKQAGATRISSKLIDVNMPHHLGWFPIDMIKKVKSKRVRNRLERKWKEAVNMLDQYGEEHPPVIVLNAWK